MQISDLATELEASKPTVGQITETLVFLRLQAHAYKLSDLLTAIERACIVADARTELGELSDEAGAEAHFETAVKCIDEALLGLQQDAKTLGLLALANSIARAWLVARKHRWIQGGESRMPKRAIEALSDIE